MHVLGAHIHKNECQVHVGLCWGTLGVNMCKEADVVLQQLGCASYPSDSLSLAAALPTCLFMLLVKVHAVGER